MSQFIFPPLTASLDSEQSDGGALPSAIMIIGGYDGSAVQAIKTDVDGNLQVDVLSSTGPSNYATDTLQTAGNAILTTIDADTGSIAGAISGSEMQVDVVAALPGGTNSIGTVILGAGTAEIGKLAAGTAAIGTVILGAGTAEIGKLAAGTASIGVLGANSGVDIGDVTLNAGTAAFGKLSANTGVDIGSVALLSGTNAVGTVILGAGTAEIGKLAAGTASIGVLGANSGVDIGDVTLNAGTAAFGKLSANSGVDIGSVGLLAGSNAIGKLAANSGVDIGDVDILSLPADSKNYVWKEGLDSTIGGITNGILDTSTTNIPSGTQLIVATLANDVYEIQTVEDIGEFIGIYAASSLKAILPLGGGSVKINLPSTTVVKLASFSGTAIASGSIAINFLG